jgi:hypothetical protein
MRRPYNNPQQTHSLGYAQTDTVGRVSNPPSIRSADRSLLKTRVGQRFRSVTEEGGANENDDDDYIIIRWQVSPRCTPPQSLVIPCSGLLF